MLLRHDVINSKIVLQQYNGLFKIFQSFKINFFTHRSAPYPGIALRFSPGTTPYYHEMTNFRQSFCFFGICTLFFWLLFNGFLNAEIVLFHYMGL